MNFLPVVERELRQLSRKAMTYHTRTLTALAVTLISLGVMAVSLGAGKTPPQLGRLLFMSLTLVIFAFSLLSGPVLTADCLSEEKRMGTMGLLFLTSLRGPHIVAGKLVALALPAVHCLLAAFPILGLCFLIGGVTGGEFFRVTLVLAGTLLFSLSTSMLLSALCRESAKAVYGTILLMLVMTIGLPLLASLLRPKIGIAGSVIGLPSCLFALSRTPEAVYKHTASVFWVSLGMNQLLSWGCLVLAGGCLPHRWQDEPTEERKTRVTGWFRREMKPSLENREWRRKMLESNPVQWLASRNRRMGWKFWLLMLALLGCGLWVAGLKSSAAVNWPVILPGIYFFHVCLKIWMAWEATRRFAEDRASGGLELLLCTPVREESIWRGCLLHLKRKFLVPVIFLLLVDILVLNGQLSGTSRAGGSGEVILALLAGMALFVTDIYALSWVGLWHGLVSRNATRACIKSIIQILVLPAAGCLGVMGLFSLLAGGSIRLPLGAVTALWFASGFISDAAACGWAMTKLREEFRAAAIYGVAPVEERKSWSETRIALQSASMSTVLILPGPGEERY
jgi:ABC-type transport system involved in multi-copper enzyme maturation permease subunit